MILGKTVGVVFVTYNASKHLDKCLPPIIKSSVVDKVLVTNSSSPDNTVERCKNEFNVLTLVTPRNEFNHGYSREISRKHINTDIVVMMTPDAYALSEDMIELLVTPIAKGEVALSYARQIPHEEADFFESFPRYHNYPSESEVRSIEQINDQGLSLVFNSNSCAAYQTEALDAVGGFENVLVTEDSLVAAKLLLNGYKIKYSAQAVVRHSHRYTLWQEFRRYVDTGCQRKINNPLYKSFGTDYKKGREFVKEFLRESRTIGFGSLIYSILIVLVKYIGFKIGYNYQILGLSLISRLSAQEFFWKSGFEIKNNRVIKSCIN